MSASQSGQSDEPPYPSFKELRSDEVHVIFSSAARRLFWPLDAAFLSSISVMKTPRSPEDFEPYFQPDIGGSGSGTWHEISQLSLTEPKVSSVEASVHDLDQWESDWIAWHGCHERDEFDADYVTYGDLSDEDRPYAEEAKEDGSWEEDSDTEFLVRCCGEDRPLRKKGLRLIVTPSTDNHFVTVHDYVSAVHPWLMSLREDILKAKMVTRFQAYSFSATTEWMVDEGPDHKIQEKQSWIERHGGGPPLMIPSSTAAILGRIRASRNR